MARELLASSGSISSLLPVQPVQGEKQVHMVTHNVHDELNCHLMNLTVI